MLLQKFMTIAKGKAKSKTKQMELKDLPPILTILGIKSELGGGSESIREC